jgi:hypothetical protein
VQPLKNICEKFCTGSEILSILQRPADPNTLKKHSNIAK